MAKHNEQTLRKMKQLGARVKSLRIEKGYSNYEQFAFQHNIARAQYGRYENGEDLRFSSLLRVIDAFDMTLAEFFEEGFVTEDID